jgi:hypothetical protein
LFVGGTLSVSGVSTLSSVVLGTTQPASTTGAIYYNTTTNTLSYYNGTNWFLPSTASFGLTADDQTSGVIVWDIMTLSDSRIMYSTGVLTAGVFTFLDIGTYVCNASFSFQVANAGDERFVQVQLERTGAGGLWDDTFIASTIDQVIAAESGNVYGNCCINVIFQITNLSSNENQVRFVFNSGITNNAQLFVFSHGYIQRIK